MVTVVECPIQRKGLQELKIGGEGEVVVEVLSPRREQQQLLGWQRRLTEPANFTLTLSARLANTKGEQRFPGQ